MKKLTLFCILTFVISQLTSAQEYGWTDISANIPTEADLSDVFFVSDYEGWITSSSHVEIYHTTDGGETFSTQVTSLGTSTGAIYMINESTGYCGGASGFVYNTEDGGNNWSFLGAISATLTDMDFVSAGQGYACGDGGAVFSITPEVVINLNSGQSSYFSGISSPSLDNVWICGGGAILYYNGSIFSFQSGPAGSYNTIFFVNDNKGWVGGDSGVLGYTEDGGENWIQQVNPDPDARALYDLFFLDENNGWAVGFNGAILKTSNGGEDWNIDAVGITTNFLRGVHFTSTTNGYVVGNGKTLLKYTSVSGIEEASAIEFEVFPNPVHENLYIKCSDLKTENGTIQILSIDGKEILKTEIRQGNESIEIDLDKLESGMYLCKIIIGNRSSIKKIIKD